MLSLLLLAGALLAPAQPENLAQKSRQARQLMAAGRYGDAIPIYEELVHAVPNNPGLLLNLGLAQQMSGRHRDAIRQFEAVLKADPKNVPALISLGLCRIALNESAAAIGPLEKAVAIDGRNAQARGLLADALTSAGRVEEAAAQYRRLAAETPHDARAWYGLGKAYEALATAAFQQLENRAAGSAWSLALVAETRLKRNQHRSAFYFFKQALEKDPKLRGAHAGLAEVYRATGHPDWASAEEEKEKRLPPPDCAARKFECDYLSGRYLDAALAASKQPGADAAYWTARAYNELALAAFSRLGALPESAEIHALRGDILRNHGQYMQAVEEWRAAVKLDPGNPQLERELAASLYLARDYRAAVPLLERLLRAEPQAADLHFFLGDSFLQQQQPEKAIPPLERATQIDPRLVPAKAALGLAYARAGENAKAIPCLLAALEIDEDGSLHYQLARAYQETGAAAPAREMLASYQQIRARSEAAKAELEKEAQITAP